MSEQITPQDVLGSGAGGPLPPYSPWDNWGTYIKYPNAVVIGASNNPMGQGTVNASDFFINGNPFDFGTVVARAGSTMTGALTLFGNPTTNNMAANKLYVDQQMAIAGNGKFLPLSGGTMTGNLILNANPTIPLQASPKQYVDSRTPITVDAPSDGNYYVRFYDPLATPTPGMVWTPMPFGMNIADAPSDNTTYARRNATWSTTFDAGTY